MDNPQSTDASSSLDRRLLLGAAGLAGIAALAAGRTNAGPLNPPAGAVAGTGRTLEEVYNRIPTLPNGSGDGRTPVAGIAGTMFISSPGSYVLTGNIDSGGSGLVISASNVTVDLNGYRVATTENVASSAISLQGALSNVTIRNGSLAGGLNGITANGSLDGLLLEDLRISGAHQIGINIASPNARCTIVRRCHVIDTGLTTTAADTNLTITGIAMSGDCHRIEDCTVTRFFYFGTGTPFYRGLLMLINGASSGCMISGCLISNDVGITGTGLTAGGGFTVYRNNAVLNFTSSYSVAGATDGGGNV